MARPTTVARYRRELQPQNSEVAGEHYAKEADREYEEYIKSIRGEFDESEIAETVRTGEKAGDAEKDTREAEEVVGELAQEKLGGDTSFDFGCGWVFNWRIRQLKTEGGGVCDRYTPTVMMWTSLQQSIIYFCKMLHDLHQLREISVATLFGNT